MGFKSKLKGDGSLDHLKMCPPIMICSSIGCRLLRDFLRLTKPTTTKVVLSVVRNKKLTIQKTHSTLQTRRAYIAIYMMQPPGFLTKPHHD